MPIIKRVAVIGGGAAGCSAAYSLSLSPDKFQATLFERAGVLGGMATSTPLDPAVYGASYMNDGVQGASPVFHNVFRLWELLGCKSSSVGMQVSFGKAEDDFWSNVFPTGVIDRFQPDIRKFGKVLKIIKNVEPIFAVLSVETMLSLFRFSKDFGEVIVYPLVALFFGTGNQTPFISSAILARVFNDDNMRLFEYSPTSFLASIPEMKAFPRLSLIYQRFAALITATNCVSIKTSHEVLAIDRHSKGVRITYRETAGIDLGQLVVEKPEKETIQVEEFDELIICADADATLKLLGKGATYLEKKILGNVKYLWDVTVTHSDEEYMKKYYNLEYEQAMASTQRDDDAAAQEQIEFAKTQFQPLYFIRSYPDDKKKIEMSFDLTHYQAQFKGAPDEGFGGSANYSPSQSTGSSSSSVTNVDSAPVKQSSTVDPVEGKKFKHVFQTIFLDRDSAQDLWTISEIKKDEIILEKWWKQQSHRVQHYRSTVPWMMLINGKNHTRFAGAWSVLNMHEIAVVSGFSAAYQLGGKYPFADDDKCKRLFTLYLALSHASRMRSEDRKGFFT